LKKNEAEEEKDPNVEARLRENAVTMNKMTDLRNRMENLTIVKRERVKKYYNLSIKTLIILATKFEKTIGKQEFNYCRE